MPLPQQSTNLFESLWSLNHRRRQAELMDDPNLDSNMLRQSFEALARINWLSRSANILWRPLVAFARRSGNRPISVLDIACGGGDVTVALARRAQRTGIRMQFAGCDLSNVALEL